MDLTPNQTAIASVHCVCDMFSRVVNADPNNNFLFSCQNNTSHKDSKAELVWIIRPCAFFNKTKRFFSKIWKIYPQRKCEAFPAMDPCDSYILRSVWTPGT